MNKYLLIILVSFSGIGQVVKELSVKIDSLNKLKIEHTKILTRLNLEISNLEQQKTLAEANAKKNTFQAIKVKAPQKTPLNKTYAMAEAPTKWIVDGEEIEIIGFENDNFKVNYGGESLFTPAVYFKDNEVLNFYVTNYKTKQKVTPNVQEGLLNSNFENKISDFEANVSPLKEDLSQETKEYLAKEMEKENLVISKYVKLGSPVALLNASITFNSLNIPEANLYFKNIGKKVIDSVEVDVHCFDKLNKRVYHSTFNKIKFTGKSKNKIEINEYRLEDWQMYGFENTSKIILSLKTIYFNDNSVLKPKIPIEIKSEEFVAVKD
jgi:hypothetical protein